jgi:hypothetical protein
MCATLIISTSSTFTRTTVTLKHLLKRSVVATSSNDPMKLQPLSASKALSRLATLHSADIVLSTTDAREIRLRRITEPTAQQKILLEQLGLTLPAHFELNRKCSADSAIA